MTKTAEQARAEIVETITANIAELSAALASNDPSSFIMAWPNVHLGALFQGGDKVQAVRVDRATIVERNDRRVAVNGRGDKAVFVRRGEAIVGALAESQQLLKTLNPE